MKRLRGLDALRGIAAAIVFAYHLGHAFGYPWLFPKGYLGVDFFFMLSGYVLSRTYDARFASGLRPRHFLGLRMKRLWPTMAVATLLAASLAGAYPPEIRLMLIAAGLLFVPIFAFNDYFPLNGPQWSILFELFANAIHALALYRLSTKLLAGAIFTAVILCGFAALKMGDLDIGGQTEHVLAGFPRVVMSYGIGMLLWRTFGDRAPSLPSWTGPFGLIIGIGAVGLLPTLTLPAEFAFVILACPSILIAGLSWDAGKAGSIIGDWSFPLYAFHAPLIYAAIGLGLGWVSAVLVVAVVSATPVALRHFNFMSPASRSRAASDPA